MPKGLYPKTAEQKRKISLALQGRKRSQESIAKGALAQKGQVPWNKGIHLTEEDKQHKSEAQKLIQPFIHTPEFNKMTGDAQRGKIISPSARYNMSIAHLGKPLSESHKDSMSIAWKRLWRDQEFRDRRIKELIAGLNIFPNKPETAILKLLEELFPEEYEYTGNGKMIINGINPDFTNINGQKKVIELFGDYWHKGEDPQIKINRYSEYGFDCLVIWEHELEHKEILINRIIEFHIKENENKNIHAITPKQLDMFQEEVYDRKS